MTMHVTSRRLCALIAACCLAPLAAAQQPPAAAPAEVTLARFADCGTPAPPAPVARFSDVYAHAGLVLQLTYSCYLIRHGSEYLVWDTGQSMSAGALAPKTSLVEQLAQAQIKPEQIRYVGISHYHPDHTGQAASFPQATLLIGKGDWDSINSAKPPVDPAPFAPWMSGGARVELVPLDKDVFGDGSVVMLATPGHTPGHHSLLVRLRETGAVLISGDMAHFHENYDIGGVPPFNTSRAETLASLARVKAIVANLNAMLLIQHDARDIGRLPPFPATAK